MERYAGMSREAIVKKCKKGDGEKGKSTCLYSRKGKLLGRHKNKQDAYKQDAAIEANKD